MFDRGFSSEHTFEIYFLWKLVRARVKCLLSRRCHCSDERLNQHCFIQCLLICLLNMQLKVTVKGWGLERGQQTCVHLPLPAASLSPQQGRLGWDKDGDESQPQPDHCKTPPQTPGLARKAHLWARTESSPEIVTSIFQTHMESHGSHPVDQSPDMG